MVSLVGAERGARGRKGMRTVFVEKVFSVLFLCSRPRKLHGPMKPHFIFSVVLMILYLSSIYLKKEMSVLLFVVYVPALSDQLRFMPNIKKC